MSFSVKQCTGLQRLFLSAERAKLKIEDLTIVLEAQDYFDLKELLYPNRPKQIIKLPNGALNERGVYIIGSGFITTGFTSLVDCGAVDEVEVRSETAATRLDGAQRNAELPRALSPPLRDE